MKNNFKMIIVKLLGGLGNQMFQYAMGKRLAILHGTEMQFEIDGLEAGEDIRKTYELGVFNIPNEEFVSVIELSEYKRKTKFKSKGLQNLSNKLNKRSMVVENGHFPFNQSFVDASTENCYVRGLWQSEKYFIDVEEEIRSDFEFKFPMTGDNLNLAQELNETMNSVALHVRRGEFANNPKFNKLIGSCDAEYFKRAISEVENRVGKVKYYVFSDDLEWAKTNLPLGDDATFVDYNSEKDHYRDIQLMSLCKHNIISNSTFSWWGAWLNRNPDKVVVAPKKWFAGWQYDTKDLIPENWTRL